MKIYIFNIIIHLQRSVSRNIQVKQNHWLHKRDFYIAYRKTSQAGPCTRLREFVARLRPCGDFDEHIFHGGVRKAPCLHFHSRLEILHGHEDICNPNFLLRQLIFLCSWQMVYLPCIRREIEHQILNLMFELRGCRHRQYIIASISSSELRYGFPSTWC